MGSQICFKIAYILAFMDVIFFIIRQTMYANCDATVRDDIEKWGASVPFGKGVPIRFIVHFAWDIYWKMALIAAACGGLCLIFE